MKTRSYISSTVRRLSVIVTVTAMKSPQINTRFCAQMGSFSQGLPIMVDWSNTSKILSVPILSPHKLIQNLNLVQGNRIRSFADWWRRVSKNYISKTLVPTCSFSSTVSFFPNLASSSCARDNKCSPKPACFFVSFALP